MVSVVKVVRGVMFVASVSASVQACALSNDARITEFSRKFTKCYCGPQSNKKPMIIESKKLNYLLEENKIHGKVIGASNRKFKVKFPSNTVAKAKKVGCQKDKQVDTGVVCWVKQSYVEGIDLHDKQFSQSTLGKNTQQPCDVRGQVVGAGSCKTTY